MVARTKSRINSCEITSEEHFMGFFPPPNTVLQGCNSLPQLLQITNGFFFPSVLQLEIGSFSYKCQVCSRSGLWRRKNRLINTVETYSDITHTLVCVLLVLSDQSITCSLNYKVNFSVKHSML